ncbi:MAG: alpha-mannosidase [Bacteroidetes bacterium]|nr:alpha-mannosidase [Bacteroidota bacterium]
MKKPAIIIFILSIWWTSQAQEKQFISNWLVVGSFPNVNTESLLDNEYIYDESKITPSAGDIYESYTWFTAKTGQHGSLDFLSMDFEQTEYCAVYAFSFIYSNLEQNVNILVGSDDGNAIYINGQKIASKMAWRGWRPDQDTVIARLGKGWNRLLVKVVNGVGDFALSVRLTDNKGSGLSDIIYSTENPYKGGIWQKPEVHPWIYAKSLAFNNKFIREADSRCIKLGLSCQVLGQPYPDNIQLKLQCLGTGGVKVYEKDVMMTSPEGCAYDFTFGINNLLPVLQEGKIFLVNLSWSGQDASYSFPLKREDIFYAIINDDLGNMPPELAEKLTYIRTNLGYAHLFYPDSLQLNDMSVFNLTKAYLLSQWAEFDRLLAPFYNEMKGMAEGLKKNTIYFAGNAHIDMAWLWKFEETVQVCYETFESVLNFADKYPGFIYSQSQAQTYWWMENRFPDYFEKIRKKIDGGQWEIVGGMWVEPDLNIPSGESLVRQLLYGKRYFMKKFGVDVKIGYDPDTFGYCWTLPQILRKAGITSFITQKLTWNDTNEFPYKIFWWEAPDGSRVLAIFPFTYVHSGEPNRVAKEFIKHKEVSGTSDQLVLYGVGNHGGGPTQENIDNIQTMKNVDAFPKVKESSIQNFSDVIMNKYKSLPEWNSELYLEYHRGTYTTQAHNKKNNRLSEISLEEAEKLSVISGIIYPKDELNEAWRLTLFNQFHDILPGSSIGEVYDDSKVQYENVQKLTGRVINWSLDNLIKSSPGTNTGIPLIVYNPLTHARKDAVEINTPLNYKQTMGLYDAEETEIPYEIVNGKIVITGLDIPATGYKMLYLREGRNRTGSDSPLKIGNDFLENEFLRVTVNPVNGNISSIFDKINNRQVLQENCEGNILQIFGDKPAYWDAWDIGYTGEEWNADSVLAIKVVTNSSQKVALRIEKAYNKSRFIQDLILYRGIARLDIANDVDWNEDHKMLKAAFNLSVVNDSATYEIPFGYIVRPTVYRNSFDSARYEVSGHKWIDLTDKDGKYGVSMLNDCKYGFDVKGSMMRITLLRSPKWPDKEADMGKHTFTYSIYPHTGGWREGNTYQRAYELNYPVLSKTGMPETTSHQRPESLPASRSFVTVSKPNIIISAIKKAEDSDEVIIRFYEIWGKEDNVEFTFYSDLISVRQTDLLERTEKALSFQGNKLTFHVKPFEINTVALKFKE